MKKNQATIELNGRRYHAHTGQPVDPPAATATSKAPAAKKPAKAIPVSHQSVDGVRPAAARPATKRHHPAKAAQRRPQHSVTLHRQAVKAPQLLGVKAADPVTPKIVTRTPNARLNRARRVKQSSAIQKFSGAGASSAPTHQLSDQPPAPAAVEAPPATPAPAAAPSKKEALIQHALHQARHTPQPAHQPAHPKRSRTKRSRLIAYGVPALAGLVLAGYVAYLNVPLLSLKIASRQAGFAASLPASQPAGYSLRPVEAGPGQVTLTFSSNTDNRQFSLTQQPSTWDSQALLENYVTKASPQYLTYQDRGLTIYIFNGSDAAWVNGGTFYSLTGSQAQLDTDQILQLATSS